MRPDTILDHNRRVQVHGAPRSSLLRQLFIIRQRSEGAAWHRGNNRRGSPSRRGLLECAPIARTASPRATSWFRADRPLSLPQTAGELGAREEGGRCGAAVGAPALPALCISSVLLRRQQRRRGEWTGACERTVGSDGIFRLLRRSYATKCALKFRLSQYLDRARFSSLVSRVGE